MLTTDGAASAGVATANEKTSSAAMLAGAIPSLSVTAEARIVTVQRLAGREVGVGSIVNELGRSAGRRRRASRSAPQEIVNQSAAVVTGLAEVDR